MCVCVCMYARHCILLQKSTCAGKIECRDYSYLAQWVPATREPFNTRIRLNVGTAVDWGMMWFRESNGGKKA